MVVRTVQRSREVDMVEMRDLLSGQGGLSGEGTAKLRSA